MLRKYRKARVQFGNFETGFSSAKYAQWNCQMIVAILPSFWPSKPMQRFMYFMASSEISTKSTMSQIVLDCSYLANVSYKSSGSTGNFVAGGPKAKEVLQDRLQGRQTPYSMKRTRPLYSRDPKP
jgi:hypothetical protein